MLRTIGRLLLVCLTFSAGMCIAVLIDLGTLITYKWQVAVVTLQSISRDVIATCRMHDQGELSDSSLDDINDWLAGDLSSDSPLAKDLLESPGKDPWGNPYRCIRYRHSYMDETRTVGFYSTGQDGVTNTSGNDADDLNSWNPECRQWYVRDINARRRSQILVNGILLTPIVYVVVIGVSWMLRLPFKGCRTRR